jgi:DNA modification methylase
MIHHGDYRTALPRIKAESVACVVTSPPFWTAHGGTEWGGESEKHAYVAQFDRFSAALRRVLRPEGMIWLVLGSRTAWATLQRLDVMDWHIVSVNTWGTSLVAQLHRQPNALGFSTLDPYAGVVTDQPYTPLARQFVRQCLEVSTSRGDIILDPCCGTGTVGIVAGALYRRFIGIEIDETTCALARARTGTP